jgi:hypothetical protein
VDEVTAASLITAIFWPGLTRIISEKLFGIMGDVVILAVGLAPIAKWQWPDEQDTRIIVVLAPNAVDWTLELVTVKTCVVPKLGTPIGTLFGSS